MIVVIVKEEIKTVNAARKKHDKQGGMPDKEMESYRIEVGHDDGVKPGNIVGAIANEADLDSQYIGHIKIRDNYSTVDLPKGMPKGVQQKLQKAYVCGKPLQLKRVSQS